MGETEKLLENENRVQKHENPSRTGNSGLSSAQSDKTVQLRQSLGNKGLLHLMQSKAKPEKATEKVKKLDKLKDWSSMMILQNIIEKTTRQRNEAIKSMNETENQSQKESFHGAINSLDNFLNSIGKGNTLSEGIIDALIKQDVLEFDGRFEEWTLREGIIRLLVDFYNMKGMVLSIRYDENVLDVQKKDEAGGLAVLTVGPNVFTSAAELHGKIESQIGKGKKDKGKGTAENEIGAPRVNSVSAIAYNKKKLVDKRSVLIIQDIVGTGLLGEFDKETVEKIAGFQKKHEEFIATADGKINDSTMEKLFYDLLSKHNHNSIIRILVDYFKIDNSNGAMLDVRYGNNSDSSEHGDAVSITRLMSDKLKDKKPDELGASLGPTVVTIDDTAFKDFKFCINVIRHEFEHGRQNTIGVGYPVDEFLSKAAEIISPVISSNQLGTDNEFKDFMENSKSVLNLWEKMSERQKKQQLYKFKIIIKKVIEISDCFQYSEWFKEYWVTIEQYKKYKALYK